MIAFDIIYNQWQLFLLVLTRVSGIFIIAPFFGNRNISVKIRVYAAFFISLILFPAVSHSSVSIALPELLFPYAYLVFSELFIGWIIGLVAMIVFSAVQMSGQILDMQIGFGMVNVLDPTSGQQMPIVGIFNYNLAVIVFLITNGHHLLLTGLYESFQLIPITGLAVSTQIVSLIIDLVSGAFGVALKISLPVVIAILLSDVALGILARTMPQMNIFIVGLPAKIMVGIFVLMIGLPFYIMFLEVIFNGMLGNIYAAFRAMF